MRAPQPLTWALPLAPANSECLHCWFRSTKCLPSAALVVVVSKYIHTTLGTLGAVPSFVHRNHHSCCHLEPVWLNCRQHLPENSTGLTQGQGRRVEIWCLCQGSRTVSLCQAQDDFFQSLGQVPTQITFLCILPHTDILGCSLGYVKLCAHIQTHPHTHAHVHTQNTS